MRINLVSSIAILSPATLSLISRANLTLPISVWRGLKELEREFDLIPELETQEAINLGLTSVAGEKRLATTLASNFNQQQLALSQQPTFGSEFSAGLGSGLGQFAGSGGFKGLGESSKQLFSRLFNQANSFFRQ